MKREKALLQQKLIGIKIFLGELIMSENKFMKKYDVLYYDSDVNKNIKMVPLFKRSSIKLDDLQLLNRYKKANTI